MFILLNMLISLYNLPFTYVGPRVVMIMIKQLQALLGLWHYVVYGHMHAYSTFMILLDS